MSGRRRDAAAHRAAGQRTCDLDRDAIRTGIDGQWLHVPVGKLHNDRYLPLHPTLIELIGDYRRQHVHPANPRLLPNEHGQPLNRYVVARMLDRIARQAGIGHVHPHKLRHTLATQAINRGMSMEAIAALLGHRSLDMTRRYARIADRTVADAYFDVADKVDALYDAHPDPVPVTELHREMSARLLGNGYCTRPRQLDCAHDSACENCVYFQTTIAFRPTLQAQHDDAEDQGPDRPAATIQRPARQPRPHRSIMITLTEITYISPVTERPAQALHAGLGRFSRVHGRV